MGAATKIRKRSRKPERGFTFIELAIAIVVLLFGVVAVAELVPRAIRNNAGNRQDTVATIIAQRELEQMTLQPLTSPAFLDQDGNAMNLGDLTSSGTVAGSPLISGTAAIDFTAAKSTGYSLTYTDPNDSQSATYDVRWAVITTLNGARPTAKRFIVGAWKQPQDTYVQPVNLDTTIEK